MTLRLAFLQSQKNQICFKVKLPPRRTCFNSPILLTKTICRTFLFSSLFNVDFPKKKFENLFDQKEGLFEHT